MDHHSYYLSVAETTATLIKPRTSLWVDEGATAYLATTTDIIGTRVPALRWYGELIGVHHLRVAATRLVEIGPQATISHASDGIIEKGTPGHFRLSTFEMGSLSSATCPPPMGFVFTAVLFDMKWSSTMTAEFFTVVATDMHTEPMATLSSKGRGMESGGTGTPSVRGAGASYATVGGAGNGGPSNGLFYDSLYEPTMGGSRGGTSSNGVPGARGGGVMRIVVGRLITLDGILDARGDTATSDAGGGSGGAIWLITGTSKGHGKMDVTGGKGSGGGAGGRIALHASVDNVFRGALVAIAGTGSQDTGGTGTVYIEAVRGSGNSTYHYSTLILDNQNVSPPKPFILSELNPRNIIARDEALLNGADFAFDEVSLWREVKFQIASPKPINETDFTISPATVTTVNIRGDGTSLFYIQEGQTFYVEFIPAEERRSVPP
ncbi:uncharacterized protein LOC144747212 isoform X2 [Ciona intestinalis]